MNLKKEKWNINDGNEFTNYIESQINRDKIEWSRRILNTKIPLLAMKTKDMKNIVKKISEGNFVSFLELELDDYYESLAISGFLIAQIKDFKLMKKHLDKYILKIDNWALCDLLSFNVKGKEKEFFELALEYFESNKPFVRRVGFVIIFNYINNDDYIDKIFQIMNNFYDEPDYYVNMINAWLFCECFIKRRDKTIEFLRNHQLNKFTINKGISKCRDSFRINQEDKELLKSFLVKK